MSGISYPVSCMLWKGNWDESLDLALGTGDSRYGCHLYCIRYSRIRFAEFGGWDFFVKKGAHMFGYAILAVSFFHAPEHHRDSRQSRFWKAVCLAIIYAASDEWHQKFTPGRTASVRDVMIDGVGACLGLALWCWIKTHIPGRKAKTRQIAEI